jgi:hypothetical protein
LEIIETIAAGITNISAIFIIFIILDYEYFTQRSAPTAFPRGITEVIIPYRLEAVDGFI